MRTKSSRASTARSASRTSPDGYVWNVRGADQLIHIPQVVTGGSMKPWVYAWCNYMESMGRSVGPTNLGEDNTKSNTNLTTEALTCLECARW